MYLRFFISLFLFATAIVNANAQQIPEVDYNPEIDQAAYAKGIGPIVVVDDVHHNFHTADGRYKPFARVLRNDGYRVTGLGKKPSLESLSGVSVLVIVNALNERNISDWSLPTPTAFSRPEIDAIRMWVQSGGSLFLVADHMPFPGSADELAREFGVIFSNGYARPGHRQSGKTDTFNFQTGLWPSFITNGRHAGEQVTEVATFGGSAFIPPAQATPVILFGPNSISSETTKAPGITPNAPEVSVEGWCQGAVFNFGRGRVAVFGEAAMFTAQLAGRSQRPMGMNAPDAEQNYQLLLNVMHWLTNANRSYPGIDRSHSFSMCCPQHEIYLSNPCECPGLVSPQFISPQFISPQFISPQCIIRMD